MSRANDRLKAKLCDALAKAIKEKCRDSCCCGDDKSWKECQSKDTCPLYPFRLGGIKSFPKQNTKSKPQNYTGKSLSKGKASIICDKPSPIQAVLTGCCNANPATLEGGADSHNPEVSHDSAS